MQNDLDGFINSLAAALADRIVSKLTSSSIQSFPERKHRCSPPALAAERQTGIEEFASELVASRLPIAGSLACAALVTDLFELYRSWCAERCLIPTSRVGDLTRYLSGKHSLEFLRKRYVSNGQTVGPHSIVFLHHLVLADEGGTDADVLGSHIQQFRDEIRSRNHAALA